MVSGCAGLSRGGSSPSSLRPVLAELRRVLDRPKFRRSLTPAEAGQVVPLIAHLAILVLDPDPAPQGLCPDPGDDHLVPLARSRGTDHLASAGARPMSTGSPRLRPAVLLEMSGPS